MIKILFFIETIEGGGAEKVLCNLVNNMDKKKFDITVQTVWHCNPDNYLSKGIHYKSVYPVKNRFNRLRYQTEAALGVFYSLHMKDDYDIECAYLECGATKALAGSTNKKAAKLAWIHCDLIKRMLNPKEFAKQTSKYYKKYDRIVCVSEKGRQSFLELFGESFDVAVVHNTVDCEEILKKSEEIVSDIDNMSEPLVVSLGRLSAPKHFIRLLQSHKRLMDEGIKHKLMILGEGAERVKLEQYIEENKLQGSVLLPGFKSNPYPYLKSADLLACSSVYECYSTFITEGLILGKPIVTTDVGGMRELLGDCEYGLITDNEDLAFYEGMKRMLSDTELRIEYEKKAVVRGQGFCTDILVKEAERFFVDCVNG